MKRIVYAIKDRFHPWITGDLTPEVRSDDKCFKDNEDFFNWCKQHGGFKEVYPVNDRIVAFIDKTEDRGRWKQWRAFIFNDAIQGDVEDFMIRVFHCPKYFLVIESKLELQEVWPFNYYYKGTWVHCVEVKCVNMKTKRKFILS